MVKSGKWLFLMIKSGKWMFLMVKSGKWMVLVRDCLCWVFPFRFFPRCFFLLGHLHLVPNAFQQHRARRCASGVGRLSDFHLEKVF